MGRGGIMGSMGWHGMAWHYGIHGMTSMGWDGVKGCDNGMGEWDGIE